MSEIVSQQPGVVRQVLESGGAQCGKGLPQHILTDCPVESFCSLAGGEVCVYGPDVSRATAEASQRSSGLLVVLAFVAVFAAERVKKLRGSDTGRARSGT